MIKAIHIFDLDGTLVDSSHRYRTLWDIENSKETIDLHHWRANEHLFTQDTLLPLADFYKAINSDPSIYTIWITARIQSHFFQTVEWLVENLGAPNKWFYRPEHYNGSGAELKRRQLVHWMNHLNARFASRHYYEDNRNYLNTVCDAINAQPVFCISNQGH